MHRGHGTYSSTAHTSNQTTNVQNKCKNHDNTAAGRTARTTACYSVPLMRNYHVHQTWAVLVPSVNTAVHRALPSTHDSLPQLYGCTAARVTAASRSCRRGGAHHRAGWSRCDPEAVRRNSANSISFPKRHGERCKPKAIVRQPWWPAGDARANRYDEAHRPCYTRHCVCMCTCGCAFAIRRELE